jgi:putative FmdB family regulatory protein
MPIYAYRCNDCGHAKDVLQKISDPVLTTCPACGAEAFQKQITAAGFQLKGSGWYVTDFRGGSGGTSAPAVGGSAAAASTAAAATSSDSASASSSASSDSSGPATGGCGTSCGCH